LDLVLGIEPFGHINLACTEKLGVVAAGTGAVPVPGVIGVTGAFWQP
jgi:hypothetical protein